MNVNDYTRDAEFLREQGISQLMNPELVDAIDALTIDEVLANNKASLRLFVNKRLPADKRLSVKAWTKLVSDQAGAEIKVDEVYQAARDALELKLAEARATLVRDIREAREYLGMQGAQFIMDRRFKDYGRDEADATDVQRTGNILVYINQPARLPPPPSTALEAAAQADAAYAEYEEIHGSPNESAT